MSILPDKICEKLIRTAQQAAGHAYAPYSGYRVGAAVLTQTGEIFSGCNIENASYGLTICAERVAMFNARNAGHSRWIAIAVYAPQPPKPLPCGACRQVMSEGGNTPVVMVIGHDGDRRDYRFEELMPHCFELADPAAE